MTDIPTSGPPRLNTGVEGLDDILGGGYPAGRNTLLVGQAGSGKTLLAVAFLVDGAGQGEPGILVSFDESPTDMAANVIALGWDLHALQQAGKLRIIDASPPLEEYVVGEGFDSTPLLIRLEYAVRQTGARRIVLDALDNFFTRLDLSETVLRREIRRLLRWFKEHDLTALLTVEAGDQQLTRSGITEFLCDTVISLGLEVHDYSAARRLRVAKLRGGQHNANNHPFIIGPDGPAVAPLSSLELDYTVGTRPMHSGVADLDQMLGGGVYQGSTTLISGPSGSGKTTFGATFLASACQRGERALLLSFEESAEQIIRNMRSTGLDLQSPRDMGLLHIIATRPTRQSLESHLAEITAEIRRFDPTVVLLDPISCFSLIGNPQEIIAMLIRLIDLLKARGTTLLMTYLVRQAPSEENTSLAVSSIADVWLVLRNLEIGGERNHGLFVIKNRGRAHSNQIREYRITDTGLKLLPVYVGPQGVLTGTARVALEAREAADRQARAQSIQAHRNRLSAQQRRLDREIERLQADFQDTQSQILEEIRQLESREHQLDSDQQRMHRLRSDLPQSSGDEP